jgi:hypothetical protein
MQAGPRLPMEKDLGSWCCCNVPSGSRTSFHSSEFSDAGPLQLLHAQYIHLQACWQRQTEIRTSRNDACGVKRDRLAEHNLNAML